MLLTPRTYSASQTLARGSAPFETWYRPRFFSLASWQPESTNADRKPDMLLVRQAGSVRVGEIIRYTLTYDPSLDEFQPPPAALHVKIKNTSAIPLRAAYLHGPYTLYASCYPKSFDTTGATEYADPRNAPQFEPYLKAGGVWYARIPVVRPNQQRNTRHSETPVRQNPTWIIEIISQVIFSSTASVNFEVSVSRDELSLEQPSSTQNLTSNAANFRDHWPSGSNGTQLLATKGVYSNSITLLLDDTASLWNTPRLPTSPHDNEPGGVGSLAPESPAKVAGLASRLPEPEIGKPREGRRKKVHLVVLTHGLHSNLGADMLYLKESIDAAHDGQQQAQQQQQQEEEEEEEEEDDDDDDDEQVIVRGFPGNAARTERGIQYLGKRLAKYVLLMTYPDQPHLPNRKSKRKNYFNFGTPRESADLHNPEIESSQLNGDQSGRDINENLPYTIARISFIGHSLGGLVQTYAIAYIQKHSPEFFDKIRPVNFVALATPFLGLSNENPLYVRFALDFGLVGRTGQDLGLSWTAPSARRGWEVLLGGKGDSSRAGGDADARAKPLLRILPSGPAHEVLARFERRTIYSNLVNDGIVPLRTSCLLFLDWKGLQRVEKARRENGIVGTMAEWGWAELTGANSKLPGSARDVSNLANVTETPKSNPGTSEDTLVAKRSGDAAAVESFPTPPVNPDSPAGESASRGKVYDQADGAVLAIELNEPSPQSLSSPLSGLLSMFKSSESGKKQAKILKRSQTIAAAGVTDLIQHDGPFHDQTFHGFNAPPRTTVFESAGDILMPPLPTIDYIVDPSRRPQTILHDRIYHPGDIPPAKLKLQSSRLKPSQDGTTSENEAFSAEFGGEAGLKVEEKIARAYHRGISWRKVLVRLEPDAHNNIIVRRMFANAYGWPVIRHLVDTHFGLGASRNPQDAYEDSSQSVPHPAVAEEHGCDGHTQLAHILSSPSAA
ncbi:lipase ROG1 family protein [Aspergillus stella-maris]|uniref:lipase ROG1 family protein n=1 Tax=Aspergillus stella-maris TaxID=1810926 RepID=UPI003CCDA976